MIDDGKKEGGSNSSNYVSLGQEQRDKRQEGSASAKGNNNNGADGPYRAVILIYFLFWNIYFPFISLNFFG